MSKLRKIVSVAIAVLVFFVQFATAVSAAWENPAYGCKTTTTIKKAGVPVTHDGVISPGEYSVNSKDLIRLLKYVSGADVEIF